MSKTGVPEMQWFTADGERKCLITRYDATLGWFLILEMKTDSIERAFQERVKRNVIFMLMSLLACILVTTLVFANFNKRIVAIENVDDLTGLPNRKLFARQYHRFVRKRRGLTEVPFHAGHRPLQGNQRSSRSPVRKRRSRDGRRQASLRRR